MNTLYDVQVEANKLLHPYLHLFSPKYECVPFTVSVCPSMELIDPNPVTCKLFVMVHAKEEFKAHFSGPSFSSCLRQLKGHLEDKYSTQDQETIQLVA